MINKYKIKINLFTLMLLFLSILALTRHYPFPKFASLSVVFLIFSFILNTEYILSNLLKLGNIYTNTILLYMIIFTIHLYKSIVIDMNNIYYAVHTYITCIMLIIAFFYPKNAKIVKIFIGIMILHSLVLIGMELFLITKQSAQFNSDFRYFIRSNGFGDVYTRNGLYFRIIIPGNELLPVAYMITTQYKEKKYKLIRFILLLATIISGNLAYAIAIMCFFIFKQILIEKLDFKMVSAIIIILILSPLLYNMAIIKIQDVLELKSSSSSTRFDQVNVLIKDMEDIDDVLFGKGMGHTVNVKTQYRDYSGDRYFEVQSAYFFNQLGMIPFGILILISLILIKTYFRDKATYIIYFSYIIYGFTNPYILNLTNIIIIIVLNSFEHEKLCNSKESNLLYDIN